MTAEIDLRDRAEDERRDRLFDALDGAESGDEFQVVADRDPDPHLVRYQVERQRALHWKHDHPDADPRELHLTVGQPLDDGDPGTFDVRDLNPQRRHGALLEIFDELGAGEGFVLVNDHDPKPLYHELHAMHGDAIEWEYVARGADEWRVKVLKTDDSEADDDGIITRFDVREIPKEERHATIHHRYGMIPDGGTIELILPHEPRPLRREFREQYGDAFTWNVVESKLGRCRVRITKTGSDAEDDAVESAGDEEVDDTPTTVDDGTIETTENLDVRDLPPAQRHERIFDAYDDLGAGEGFVLVNDHDPKPLYHQFEAEAGPEFHWSYRQREPGEFRVLIGKTETTGESAESRGTEAPF